MKQGKFELTQTPRLNGAKKLAKRLGICRSYLYAITRGKTTPSPRLAARMRRLGLLPEDGKVVAE